MIKSFRCKHTEAIFQGRFTKRFGPDVLRAARRRLAYLREGKSLDDLKNPPGNNLESLSGDRKGQYSLRVNDQWRLCFRWTEEGAEDVELVDYH